MRWIVRQQHVRGSGNYATVATRQRSDLRLPCGPRPAVRRLGTDCLTRRGPTAQRPSEAVALPIGYDVHRDMFLSGKVVGQGFGT